MAEYIYKKKLVQRILNRRREKRYSFIMEKVVLSPGMRILDVGCGPNGRSFEDFLPHDYLVQGIDLYESDDVKITHPNFSYKKMDARDLGDFSDKQFDLAVSIGMMEHICDQTALEAMASEIQRVSKQWIIVVPWKYAWIEPHFKFPFFQLLPFAVQTFLIRLLNLHGLRDRITVDPDFLVSNYQWLSNREWQRIFRASEVFVTPFRDTIAIVESA